MDDLNEISSVKGYNLSYYVVEISTQVDNVK